MATPNEYQSLRTLAEDVAQAAAELVWDRRSNQGPIDTKSSSADMVTATDRAAEELLVSRILAARPDDSIVGEEGTGVVGTSGFRWVLDPIDGTANFVYGYPGFGVSVAVQHEIAPQAMTTPDVTTVVGVVVDIMHSDTLDGSGDRYSAALGAGATRNGEAISVSGADALEQSLVATGFSFLSERRARQGAALAQILPNIRDIRRQGSAAVDLCSVACGRVDAYFEIGLNEWDLAAGALIAAEAGARVDVSGTDADRFTFAASPQIADALWALLESSGAQQA